MKRNKKECILLLSLLLISLFIYTNMNGYNVGLKSDTDGEKKIQTSAKSITTKQWIKNPTFESPIEPIWFWENGSEGDNSDMEGTTSPGQANVRVLGDTQTFTVVSGTVNSSTSQGWKQIRNGDFQFPTTSLINNDGCFVYHYWHDDTNQAPSVHWKTNVSVGIDMSEYKITSASLEVIFNATVDPDIDTPRDSVTNFAIGDSVTFYSQISDLSYNPPLYTVARNKTKYLGQYGNGNPSILSIPDKPMETVSELDLITALNSAFEKDPSHSNFTLTLGIDVYSEDNEPGTDYDHYTALLIKTCNLTFTCEKRIDEFTSVAWNQVGNQLSGPNIQIKEAIFNFEYKVDSDWPTSAPLSEINFYFNSRKFEAGSIKLNTANNTFQEARLGGFNVTSLILKDVNISVSIEIYLKDTFELDDTITISIDNVFLNITYVDVFPDYSTDLRLFLNDDEKTTDPIIQIPIDTILNITVKYIDNITSLHIPGAIVQLEGKVSGSLLENSTFNHYSILVNSSQLGLGSRILSVEAQKTNYETRLIQIFVEVYERGTELSLVVNGRPRVDSETIKIETNEIINISIFFTDLITSNHLSGASVELLGIGFLNESTDYYNITIDSNDLNLGTNILTIFSQLDNYQTQTIKFFINVVERSTQLQIFLNQVDVSLDPVIEVPIGYSVNVTIKYTDNKTSTPIPGGTLQLIGEGLSINLIENASLNQYSTILNPNQLPLDELPLDEKLFSIVAQAPNFRINVRDIRINIRPINTSISTFSGETNIFLGPGESYTLRIYLNNLDYEGFIINATVTYRWAYGQGELMDLDNDGNYTATFHNIPGGTHIMIITAFAGKDYEFEDYTITISVATRPGIDWTWLIIILGCSALV
ncbi:MAG: hypothetical protein ACFFBI_06270, partial [Promethearchaeota archaeon]